ncbi:MAG: dihydroorotate dehydrogenase-like protein [Bacteroidetes bacterium]|nr:dihydroorotate dehydrogenase-like protein [Bacteroidota bacterium]
MTNLKTQYMGLDLKNPIIVASSGLTASVDKIKTFAKNGAAAIVLKSLFEEQLVNEGSHTMEDDMDFLYPEAIDYISNYTKNKGIKEYCQLIRDAKAAVDIPIIASINCVSAGEWMSMAKLMQDAGADALELNIAILPSNEKNSSEANESVYFSIIEKVHRVVNIPIALKISSYSAGLAKLIKRIDWTEKVNGIVMFNRFYNPDIDIDKLTVTNSGTFSHKEEYFKVLRWVALMSGKINADISATTGIHDAETVIKQLLAGAKTVQLASVLYKNGAETIQAMLFEIEKWMEAKGFKSIDEFRGMLNYEKTKSDAAFERIQFMKYFADVN